MGKRSRRRVQESVLPILDVATQRSNIQDAMVLAKSVGERTERLARPDHEMYMREIEAQLAAIVASLAALGIVDRTEIKKSTLQILDDDLAKLEDNNQ